MRREDGRGAGHSSGARPQHGSLDSRAAADGLVVGRCTLRPTLELGLPLISAVLAPTRRQQDSGGAPSSAFGAMAPGWLRPWFPHRQVDPGGAPAMAFGLHSLPATVMQSGCSRTGIPRNVAFALCAAYAANQLGLVGRCWGRRGKSEDNPDALASVTDAGEGGEVRRQETGTSSLLSKPRARSSPRGDTGSSPRYSGWMRCRRWGSAGWRPMKEPLSPPFAPSPTPAHPSTHTACAAPTIRSVQPPARCAALENLVGAVLSVYENMRKVGVEPNVYTYNLLIKVMCQNDWVDAERKMLDDEISGWGRCSWLSTRWCIGYCSQIPSPTQA